MQGGRCRVTPLLVDHAPALHAANAEDDEDAIWTWLPYGPFETEAAYAGWVAWAARGADPLFFAIEVAGEPLGVASHLRIAPEAGTIEIGHICLAPRLQGTAAATEALTLMIGWAFEAGYRRLEWKCNALNRASRRAAQRFGFSYEGVFRQATVSKGRNRDTAWFAIIDAEWPALRQAFTLWLDDTNFDDAGRQRRRLGELTAPQLAARDPTLEEEHA
jgi:RimJ/RimL family protein N-acetyltransferase